MYNPKNAKEIEGLEPDKVYDGIIVEINSGTVKDFIENLEKWKTGKDHTAMQMVIEVAYKEGIIRFNKVFTYDEENGQTVYKTNSNLGKYKKKYGMLPEVENKVKCLTNGEGFLSLTIE